MRKELDDTLCTRYPEIFRDRNAPANKTCMCWGFECGDGWYHLIDRACALIQYHITYRNTIKIPRAIQFNQELIEASLNDFVDYPDWKSRTLKAVPEVIEQVVATQVKEKFGGLRFYYTGGDDYIRGVVTLAEDLSYVTCEVCGAPAVDRSVNGWIRTRCEEHS